MGTVSSKKRWALPVQRVVRRVLHADPGQEYYVYVPKSGGQGAPLLVAVHGISRNARELAKLFSKHAESEGVVLVAPLFSVERCRDYQRLGREGRGIRADRALEAIVEEVALLTSAEASEFYLFGYSGGAQFAHRYSMANPHRVACAVVAAAGWYSFPDARERFPYGIAPHRDLPGVRFDPEEFLRVPITVLVGDADTGDDGVRRTARVDRQQGETRVERARNWVAAMRAAAEAYRLPSLVRCETIPGGEHSFAALMKENGLGATVFTALFDAAPRAIEGGGNGTKSSGNGKKTSGNGKK